MQIPAMASISRVLLSLPFNTEESSFQMTKQDEVWTELVEMSEEVSFLSSSYEDDMKCKSNKKISIVIMLQTSCGMPMTVM